MLRSALVAVDGSPCSDSATTLAPDWAVRFDARLFGLGIVDEKSVHPLEPVPLGAGAYKKARDEARMADAHHRVAGFVADFRRAPPWPASTRKCSRNRASPSSGFSSRPSAPTSWSSVERRTSTLKRRSAVTPRS